jgi:hypothetical protein
MHIHIPKSLGLSAAIADHINTLTIRAPELVTYTFEMWTMFDCSCYETTSVVERAPLDFGTLTI